MTAPYDRLRNPERKRRSPLASSVALIANVAGVLAAFFGTTFVHALASEPLRAFTGARYGEGWMGVVDGAAFCLIALALFALGRALVAGGFTALALRMARHAF